MEKESNEQAPTNKLKEVFFVFFKMGCFAFGGPAVHIALMEEEIVRKRKWMSHAHFLDLIGATNLIPGPNSTEMTMHCGHERAGFKGLLVAGLSFIFPAIIITGVFAWLYVEYGSLPTVEPFIAGIKPAVLAVIAGAVLKLGKKAMKGWELVIIGLLTLIASYWMSEVVALLAAGLFGIIYFSIKNNTSLEHKAIVPLLSIPLLNTVAIKLTSLNIFWIFLKVGAVLYGSGYVLFAYLDAELVEKGFLTQQQLMDAVAVGQFTPGPVLSTATFIGYQLNGVYGAIASTAGIFLPSFILVILLNPLVPKLRKSKVLGYFLDSVNVAAVAVMLAVLIKMSWITLVDWKMITIALLSFVTVFYIKKVSSIWIIIGGAVLGYVFSFI